jgi:hypothetical protein
MCKQNNVSQKINPQQTNPQLRVYVANLGKYVEGELVGAWLDLPATVLTKLNISIGLCLSCYGNGVIYETKICSDP